MFWPTGAAFQLAAIIGAHDRTEQLGQLDLPALVIHGRADPLVTLSGGEATAAAIPHAKLVVYNDMGHDLPPPLFQDYVSDVITVMRRAD
jgi:pimeloyl-ACP methyl ester carboxylesterase